ncbi:hypothetical protein PIB30_081496, partial [Stylosanthes scabra]|nr:hypothetical protein [Stylosanthes scabra]
MSHGVLNQSHFSYHDTPPPYGRGFQNYGSPAANFSPHQTVRPRNPFVTPGFQDDDGRAAIFLQPQIARPIGLVVVPPQRLINPFVASGFQDDDRRAASFFQHQTTRLTNHVSTPPAGRTNPVATPPARRTNSVATSPARLTNRAAGPQARPTNPVVAPRAGPMWCKICEVRISGPKTIEEHNKGKNHQNMLKKHERSEELRAIRKREREQVPSAPVNSVDRSKTVQKSEREIHVERHKDYLGKFVVETSNIPAEKDKEEQRDNSVTRGSDSKRKIEVTNGGSEENQIKRIRRTIEASKDKGESRHNTVSEGNDSKRKFRGNDGSNHKNNIKQLRDVASSKPERELRHKSVVEGHDSKLKSGGTSGCNDKKIKKRRRVIKSSKSDINSPSNCEAAESNVQVSTVAPPEQSMPMPLQVLLPEPAVGSDPEPQIQPRVLDKLEHQSSEAVVNHNSLITTDETNVQPSSSMSMELDAPVNSSTNNEISNGNGKVEENMEVLDISPLSNYVESTVQDPTAAPPQKPTLLRELSPSPLEGSNSEPVIQPFVQVELEHRVSEDNAHYESENPTDEINVHLPSLISMEFDAPVDSSTNTEISNENSIAEENMEVLTDLRISSIFQENVCFVCGNQGFLEALVHCNKCQISARHM